MGKDTQGLEAIQTSNCIRIRRGHQLTEQPHRAGLMESIDALNRDLTIIIIAHRLTTVQCRDQIIELAHGKFSGARDLRAVAENGSKAT